MCKDTATRHAHIDGTFSSKDHASGPFVPGISGPRWYMYQKTTALAGAFATVITLFLISPLFE